jgi:ubiquinone biosynthesis protein
MISLGRAGIVLARSDLMTPAVLGDLPAVARWAIGALRLGVASTSGRDLGAALQRLGPSHIKLGQFLATRPDVVGQTLAGQLSKLQDKLEPFSQTEAIAEIERGLGAPVNQLFESFGPPVAAASIAQVHKAKTPQNGDGGRTVAVKVLRPGIERRFSKDLAGFRSAASAIEFLSKPARRLRPVAAVETLARTVELEMDLRLEAAAISEMAGNIENDPGFRVPRVDWARTSRRVLTLDWVDGIAISDIDALAKSGHDLEALGAVIIQSFLRHAMRDGFFHADMHPGNLFVDADGLVVAVDFGIMGRLEPKDRLFLAEILHGFITGNYKRVASVHFDAGYVPADQSVELFAQALRAIGEPLMDKQADDISMARLLTQLFQVTEQFEMQTQPQLLLLQKTMVVVEGVARMLDPKLNMWTIAEPVVADWMTARLGPEGRIADAAEGAATLGRVLAALPEAAARFERLAASLENQPANHNSNQQGNGNALKWAVWLAAIALCAIAAALLF